MNYFELLNLRREPFSNSPDPELFYDTVQHRECLRSLEISVRLRRGALGGHRACGHGQDHPVPPADPAAGEPPGGVRKPYSRPFFL